MNDKKLECLVDGYEGTYYELGQVWETKGGAKVTLKGFSDDKDYPLLFDVGYRALEEFTQRGTFYEDVEYAFDLVKLISTESTPSKPQPKTLSEYLKENDAYEIFIENCVEVFLKDLAWYKDSKSKSINISSGNIFIWGDTKEGHDYWYNLEINQPENLIYDMGEIIFAEVDKRLSKEEKSPKRYMLFVEGKSSPKKIHTDLETAEEEAKRLATREIGSKVFLVEIVKEYKSRLEIDEH